MLAESLIIASTLLAAAGDATPARDKPAHRSKPAGQYKKANKRPSPAEFARLFQARKFVTGEGTRAFRYRLFVPRSIQPGQRYPLLLWLHGFGERGDDNVQELKHIEVVIGDRRHLEKYPFFILVPQCPEEGMEWFRPGGEGASTKGDSLSFVATTRRAVPESGQSPGAKTKQPPDMLAVAIEILRQTIRECPVDEDRVYLTGVSEGGTACWEMAMRYPEVFAAVVPLSSAGGDVSRADKLTGIPTWAFHNRNDRKTPPRGVEETVAAVKGAGGSAELTLFDGTRHDSWTAAFRDGAMEWMLAQRRGSYFAPSPGYRPWRLWHVLTVPAVVVAVVWLGWRFGRKRGKGTNVQ